MGPDKRIIVIGLGYVGLPLAIALARKFQVVGFDVDGGRVRELRGGHDRTNEVDPAILAASNLKLTTAAADCAGADVYIVTVPTPVDQAKRPDLSAVVAATRMIAGLIDPKRRPTIAYESTVYPGSPRIFAGPRSSARRVSAAAAISASATVPSASIPATASIVSSGSPKSLPVRTTKCSSSSPRSTAR